MLEEELLGQAGDGEGAVAILPTVRVNRKQYRGTLEAGSVLRAVCAAFPAGGEPPVCNQKWVSEDECAEGGDGWRACRGRGGGDGRTQCVNTFRGYECECGDGYMRVKDKVGGCLPACLPACPACWLAARPASWVSGRAALWVVGR
jgi:hypothetical protein